MRHAHVFGLLFLSAALLASPAHAKDNTVHMMGLGFQAAPFGVEGYEAFQPVLLSARFAAASNAEFALLLGLAAEEGVETGFGGTEASFALSFGGKALLHLIPEENLNLSMGITLLPTIGSEGFHSFTWLIGPSLAYYLPGASNLELFAEFGIGGTLGDLDLGPSFATTGNVVVGLHYWL